MMNFNETIKQLTSSTRNHASNFNEVNNQLLENTIYNKAHHELLKEQVKALEESSQTTEWEEVIGKPTTYPPENHSHDWDSLQGKPSTFPATEHRHNVREIDGLDNIGGEVTWNSITGKPNMFPPSSHTHTKSQISDFPSSLPANGGNADTVDGKHASDFALASHGNHVPAKQSANNAVYLRNDNTWQTITPAKIGAASVSHTHAEYATGTSKIYQPSNNLRTTLYTSNNVDIGGNMYAGRFDPKCDGIIKVAYKFLRYKVSTSFTGVSINAISAIDVATISNSEGIEVSYLNEYYNSIPLGSNISSSYVKYGIGISDSISAKEGSILEDIFMVNVRKGIPVFFVVEGRNYITLPYLKIYYDEVTV